MPVYRYFRYAVSHYGTKYNRAIRAQLRSKQLLTLSASECGHINDDGRAEVLHSVRDAISQHQSTLRIRVVHFNSLARVQRDDLRVDVAGIQH